MCVTMRTRRVVKKKCVRLGTGLFLIFPRSDLLNLYFQVLLREQNQRRNALVKSSIWILKQQLWDFHTKVQIPIPEDSNHLFLLKTFRSKMFIFMNLIRSFSVIWTPPCLNMSKQLTIVKLSMRTDPCSFSNLSKKLWTF